MLLLFPADADREFSTTLSEGRPLEIREPWPYRVGVHLSEGCAIVLDLVGLGFTACPAPRSRGPNLPRVRQGL